MRVRWRERGIFYEFPDLYDIAQDFVDGNVYRRNIDEARARIAALEAENREIFGLRQREKAHAEISEERLEMCGRLRERIAALEAEVTEYKTAYIALGVDNGRLSVQRDALVEAAAPFIAPAMDANPHTRDRLRRVQRQRLRDAIAAAREGKP